MRNFLLGLVALFAVVTDFGVAKAADVFPPQPEAAAQVYNWGGVYAGVNTGFAWDRDTYTLVDVPVDSVDVSGDGWTVGAHSGVNFQLTNLFLLGAELEGGWSNQEGKQDFYGTWTGKANTDWWFNAKARAGITLDRFLVYATAGYAGADVGIEAHEVCPGACVGHSVGDSAWANGWLAGAGIEYAITDNMIAGLEYNHTFFRDVRFEDKIYGQDVRVDGDLDADIIKVRASFKF